MSTSLIFNIIINLLNPRHYYYKTCFPIIRQHSPIIELLSLIVAIDIWQTWQILGKGLKDGPTQKRYK